MQYQHTAVNLNPVPAVVEVASGQLSAAAASRLREIAKEYERSLDAGGDRSALVKEQSPELSRPRVAGSVELRMVSRGVRATGGVIDKNPVFQFTGEVSPNKTPLTLGVWAEQGISLAEPPNEIDLTARYSLLNEISKFGSVQTSVGAELWIFPKGDLEPIPVLKAEVKYKPKVADYELGTLVATYSFRVPNGELQSAHQFDLKFARPFDVQIGESTIAVTPNIQLVCLANFFSNGAGCSVLKPGVDLSYKILPNLDLQASFKYQIPLDRRLFKADEFPYGGLTVAYRY